MSTGSVANCLPVIEEDEFLRQVRSIQAMITAGRPMTVESSLKKGQAVRIKSGPLMNVEGVVLNRRGDRRFVVSVDFLQKGASVALEDWEIERL